MRAIIDVETGDVTYREDTAEEVALAASFDTTDDAVTADPIAVLVEIGEALSTITPSSTSTALRTALLAMRTVIDNAVQT